ncbi:major facilitator superfamily domain-containing protein [Naematelia encephala]|uniref:Major facilitator superfamily domain-containing protein n=1 Tax=Naematelia encephala TaxID=71784 RepID=A0A1Y2APH7_9TREE|nr:major facilitator superfamily domain-containing protein [Naematelia encephala]
MGNETELQTVVPQAVYLATGDLLATANSKPQDTEDETKWHKAKSWKGLIWDSFDKPKDERWLLFKLDLTLLTVACMGTFIRSVDQSNINNAFVSGMKEDLGLYGNELNTMGTCFQIGYAIGQIPTTMILTKLRPHYYLAGLELAWAALTFGASGVTKVGHLYLIRFLVGFLESGYFPAVMWICGGWYTRSEIAKRTVIIQVASTAGSMFSGYFQAAAYNGLNGHLGKPGWKWGFIIDGVISAPIGLLTFFIAPDVPSVARPNWVFSAEELDLSRRRKPLESYEKPDNFTKAKFKKYFTTWQFWLFSLLFICTGSCSNPSSSMAFWFKSYNVKGKPNVYSVAQINVYPTPIQAVQILFSLVCAWSSDTWLKGRRWPPVLLAAVIVFSVDISLGATVVHGNNRQRATRWALYYFTTLVTGTTGIIWAWVQEACLGDAGKRAFVGASMNMFSVVFQAWVPNVLFPTYDQPFVVKGNFGTAGFCAGAFTIASLIAFAQLRDARAKPTSDEEDLGTVTHGDSVSHQSEEDEK